MVLTIAIWANILGLSGDDINSYYRTSFTKNCRAPGRIDCAPGLKYLDTPDKTHTFLSAGWCAAAQHSKSLVKLPAKYYLLMVS